MLLDLLKQRSDRLHDRWVEEALAAYPKRTAAVWTREKDRFANPVGHSLREGTRRLLDGLLEGAEPRSLRDGLDEIVRIRAVQRLSPAQALAFVFRLKAVVRDELASDPDGVAADELVELEKRIDDLGLVAFDLFTHYRERVLELRMEELKRTIPWVVGRSANAAGEEGVEQGGTP
ncbi:MAG TPA: RsbRD N-terminal domain-containing protein [Longimicrobiales bacterium]|jgi:hypothetical protein|nr:RsbRD N-terminal domain-containing protein [Longimicrobiales bacterium]